MLGEVTFNNDHFAVTGTYCELLGLGVGGIAVASFGLFIVGEFDSKYSRADVGFDQCTGLKNLDLGIVLLTDRRPKPAICVLCSRVNYVRTENDPVTFQPDAPLQVRVCGKGPTGPLSYERRWAKVAADFSKV